MLINMVTEGGTWAAHDVTADQVLARVALSEDGSPSLGAYARDMIDSALDRGNDFSQPIQAYTWLDRGILAPPGGEPPTGPRVRRPRGKRPPSPR